MSASGGKEERNVVKIQEGGDGAEGRGSKDRRATEGEERVKRKVGRNTHSLSPLLFLFLRESQIKARGKAKKKVEKTSVGTDNTERRDASLPQILPLTTATGPPVPLEPICLTLFQHLLPFYPSPVITTHKRDGAG